MEMEVVVVGTVVGMVVEVEERGNCPHLTPSASRLRVQSVRVSPCSMGTPTGMATCTDREFVGVEAPQHPSHTP